MPANSLISTRSKTRFKACKNRLNTSYTCYPESMRSVSIFYTIVLCAVAGLSAFSQTKRIAHKSHSGTAASFSRYSAHNFGLPPIHLDSVLKLSDKKVVRYRSYGYTGSQAITDTISHHIHFINPSISLDSLKTLFPDTKFIGFDKAPPHQEKAGPSKKKKKSGTGFWMPSGPYDPGTPIVWTVCLVMILSSSLSMFWVKGKALGLHVVVHR